MEAGSSHCKSPVMFLVLRLWLVSKNVFLFLIYGNSLICSLISFKNDVGSLLFFSLEVTYFSSSQTVNYICIDIQIMLSSVCHCVGKCGVHKLGTGKIYHSFDFEDEFLYFSCETSQFCGVNAFPKLFILL